MVSTIAVAVAAAQKMSEADDDAFSETGSFALVIPFEVVFDMRTNTIDQKYMSVPDYGTLWKTMKKHLQDMGGPQRTFELFLDRQRLTNKNTTRLLKEAVRFGEELESPASVIVEVVLNTELPDSNPTPHSHNLLASTIPERSGVEDEAAAAESDRLEEAAAMELTPQQWDAIAEIAETERIRQIPGKQRLAQCVKLVGESGYEPGEVDDIEPYNKLYLEAKKKGHSDLCFHKALSHFTNGAHVIPGDATDTDAEEQSAMERTGKEANEAAKLAQLEVDAKKSVTEVRDVAEEAAVEWQILEDLETRDTAEVAVKPAFPTPEKKPEDTKKEDTENYTCGLHSDACNVLVFGPLSVTIVFRNLGAGKMVWTFVAQHWANYGGVVEKFLFTNGDLIVVGAAATCLTPIAIPVAVNLFRATMDLGNFAWWQQALLGTLVFSSLATLYSTEGALCTFDVVKKEWDKVSNPIEDFLIKKTDSIIAGAAVCCLAPIVGSLIMCLRRRVWICRGIAVLTLIRNVVDLLD